jgi:uncharacterized surface protein with fasciclin (FAS1) repeats
VGFSVVKTIVYFHNSSSRTGNMKFIIFAVLSVSIATVYCQARQDGPSLNVVETARRMGVVSYLLALEETNSLDFLATEANITVFMPSNEAFLKVSDVERAKWKSDPVYYKNLMRYHVLKGRFNATNFNDEQTYVTYADNNISGRFINYTGYSKSIQLYENAVIQKYDNEASNGVIHLLDDVVTVEQVKNIWDLAQADKDLSMLVDAIKKLNLTEDVSNVEARTFLAPTNEAIGKLPDGTWATLTNNSETFNETLKLHLNGQGTWYTVAFQDKLEIPSLNPNKNWTFTIDKANKIFVNGKAQFVNPDQAGTNGIMHTIDTVLLLSL